MLLLVFEICSSFLFNYLIEKFHGYEIIEIWPKYSTSAPIEFIQRAHARWNTSTITRFIL